ncbi:MAG: NADAR domain-containing protein, partial [Halioglobus sp.]
MFSLDLPGQTCIGRGVRYFDCLTWDCVREDVVLAVTFATFTRNTAMKQHLSGTGTKCLAEASLFKPMWVIDLRTDDPEAEDSCRWRKKQNCSGNLFQPFATQFAQGRPGWRTSPPPMTYCSKLVP